MVQTFLNFIHTLPIDNPPWQPVPFVTNFLYNFKSCPLVLTSIVLIFFTSSISLKRLSNLWTCEISLPIPLKTSLQWHRIVNTVCNNHSCRINPATIRVAGLITGCYLFLVHRLTASIYYITCVCVCVCVC